MIDGSLSLDGLAGQLANERKQSPIRSENPGPFIRCLLGHRHWSFGASALGEQGREGVVRIGKRGVREDDKVYFRSMY